ncbi:hypothetical protein AB205_0054840 [Aquarana catesbeiana]|uniref:Transmembrane 9 superfamily member n=1 Tax=Aquarana catesbeiana TaxID=8400 RepID=A0A2G9S630_AQUCT|nr:hypothetical protein AB205_0054840 [Aquarana catesbeiana]
MNVILWVKGSSAAIPFGTLVAILAMWFGISVPLTFLGAYFGFKERSIEHPVRTNQIPRQIPCQSFFTKPVPGIVMGGILPFGCIFIQLFFILNSICVSGTYQRDSCVVALIYPKSAVEGEKRGFQILEQLHWLYGHLTVLHPQRYYWILCMLLVCQEDLQCCKGGLTKRAAAV